MKTKRFIWGFTLLLFNVSSLISQEILISQKEVLKKVSEQNISLKISEQDYKKAKADFNHTKSVFLPSITVSHTGFSTTNPLMVFGSKLNQEILTSADFNPTLLNNPKKTQNFTTKIEIQQPLINLDGFYQRKAAKFKMLATSLKSERKSEYLSFEVKKTYMQLQLAYKGVGVFEKALETAKSNKQIAENNFKHGYLQQIDILNVNVRITEVKSQLQAAMSNVKNISNYLSFMMNDNSNVFYKPKDSLTLTTTIIGTNNISESRSDIKAMRLVYDAYKTMNKADKMSFLPRLNAFGSYELHDNNLFRGNANGYLIGAQLTWNLFDGFKRFGKTQKSKAAFDKAKLEYKQYVSKSNLELNRTKRQLLEAKDKLHLKSLEVQQSKESLRIRRNRFKEGLEKTSDLLIAETKYAQKQLEYYQTIFEHNLAQAYLEFLTKE
ncbi:MAG: TolC family protein [Flavobacteriaceae bacterium]|nr:TolC family protein [Flavobacteriaceae bacterium]